MLYFHFILFKIICVIMMTGHGDVVSISITGHLAVFLCWLLNQDWSNSVLTHLYILR